MNPIDQQAGKPVQPLGKQRPTGTAEAQEPATRPSDLPRPDIDQAVEGRDRLKGNEQTKPYPGVPDSGQA